MFGSVVANRLRTMLSILCVWVGDFPLHAQPVAKINFERDIRPLFREHCVECHGPHSRCADSASTGAETHCRTALAQMELASCLAAASAAHSIAG
jgi:hypothetical protein